MLYVVRFLVLVILEISAGPSNVSLFDKFHQSDFKFKFEHMDVVSYNKNVFKRFEIATFKYNQTCAVSNLTMEFNIDVGNKLELVAQAYIFRSNEYRYFPVRLQAKFCFAISKNLIGLGNLIHSGNFSGCPFQRGKIIHACRWAPDESKFSPLIPNGRYKLDMQFVFNDTEGALFAGYGEVYRPFV